MIKESFTAPKQPQLGSRCPGLHRGLGCRKERVQLVEKQTGGEQVLRPQPDAALKAESPGGLDPRNQEAS